MHVSYSSEPGNTYCICSRTLWTLTFVQVQMLLQEKRELISQELPAPCVSCPQLFHCFSASLKTSLHIILTATQAKFFKHSSFYTSKRCFCQYNTTADLVSIGLLNMQCTACLHRSFGYHELCIICWLLAENCSLHKVHLASHKWEIRSLQSRHWTDIIASSSEHMENNTVEPTLSRE